MVFVGLSKILAEQVKDYSFLQIVYADTGPDSR